MEESLYTLEDHGVIAKWYVFIVHMRIFFDILTGVMAIWYIYIHMRIFFDILVS